LKWLPLKTYVILRTSLKLQIFIIHDTNATLSLFTLLLCK
ncbi:TPA: DUF159 family protein, partial [Acinetobacter baumannii]|nr:DUF159 family protein [Acinetobacter baumannii]